MGAHISSALLELYALGRRAEAQMAAVEEHLLVCEVCRKRLQRVEEYVSTLRWGLSTIDEVLAVHETTEGPVYLFARQNENGYVARVLGRELDYGRECGTLEEAEHASRAAFTELFPEHVCSEACQSRD